MCLWFPHEKHVQTNIVLFGKNFLSKKKREGRKEGGGSLWVQGKGGCPATNMQSTGLSSVDAWTQNEEERSYQESAKPWDSSSNLKYLPLPWHSKLHTTISSTKKSMRMSSSTKAVSNAPNALSRKRGGNSLYPAPQGTARISEQTMTRVWQW